MKEEKKKRPGIPVILTLLLIFALFILAYFYFFYPTAVIELKPVIKEVKEEIILSGKPGLNSVDWEKRVLPMYPVEVEITDKAEMPTSGEKTTGETRAKGRVRFINENQKPVSIPVGTVVKTDKGIKFKTLKKIEVPALEVDYLMDLPVGMRAGQAEVEIECLQKGSEGNVSTGSIGQMEKKISNILVINPAPTSGGEDKHYSVVAEKDLANLNKIMEENLKNKLITKVYQELGGNYRIIEEGINFSEVRIDLSHKQGEAAEKLEAEGRLAASGYVIKNSELDRLVSRVFQEGLADRKKILNPGIEIVDVKLEQIEDKLYNIKIELEAPVIFDINKDSLVNNLKGVELESARKMLEEREDIALYNINSKKERLPGLGFAIKVIIMEPDSQQVFEPVERRD